ncbi:MAG: 3-dehydroquinate synthase, partial [Microthrixaceae bacterium]|nr:3-dehydroquinate synthase [Microthrixaceae bacterium]
LCSEFARFGLTRADCVVGVGGGLVTDVSGLAASLYHRGIPVIHVATTLLAQIDAAIGGKT